MTATGPLTCGLPQSPTSSRPGSPGKGRGRRALGECDSGLGRDWPQDSRIHAQGILSLRPGLIPDHLTGFKGFLRLERVRCQLRQTPHLPGPASVSPDRDSFLIYSKGVGLVLRLSQGL